MKQKLVIKRVEHKETKTGKDMWTVETDTGKYSVFDAIVAGYVDKYVNWSCEVEVEIKGNYKNIVKFYEAISEVKASKYDTIETASENKLKSIAVSYAHDVAIAEITALVPKTKDMAEAKALIKDIKQGIAFLSIHFYNLITELDELQGMKVPEVITDPEGEYVETERIK